MKLKNKWKEIAEKKSLNVQMEFLKDSLKLYSLSPKSYSPFLMAALVVAIGIYFSYSKLLARTILIGALSFFTILLLNYYLAMKRYIRKWDK